MWASDLLTKIREDNNKKADKEQGGATPSSAGVTMTTMARFLPGMLAEKRMEYLNKLKDLGCLRKEVVETTGRPAIEWFWVQNIQEKLNFQIRRPKKIKGMKAVIYEYMNDLAGDQNIQGDYLHQWAKDGWELVCVTSSGNWIWRRKINYNVFKDEPI